jgi:hypothetical protein
MKVETLYGPWRIEVVEVRDHPLIPRSQRFMVEGSDNADGVYRVTVGDTLAVSGAKWHIRMEWFEHVNGDWIENDILRVATFDVQRGLLVTLGGGRGTPPLASEIWRDLVLVCQSEDPALNPDEPPPGAPFEFSFPESFLTRSKRST